MKKENPDLPKFAIPENFLEQLYEFSGGADKYKGILLAYCDEYGTPNIYTKYDSTIVDFGLIHAMEDYIQHFKTEQVTK